MKNYKISEKILLEVIACLGNPVVYKYTTDSGRENMKKFARKTMDELIKKGIFKENNFIEILKKN
jgi:hypothetical protein